MTAVGKSLIDTFSLLLPLVVTEFQLFVSELPILTILLVDSLPQNITG